jgi:hypothetical protein
VTVVDARGRLLGVVNLIDFAIGVAAVAALGVGVAAYRVFNVPEPIVERVEPPDVPVANAPRVTIVGRHLRHYLRAYVPRTGEPFAVTPTVPDGPGARFLSVTEDRAELQLPRLTPGGYDLYLFDETKQVAHIPRAFSIVPSRTPRGVLTVEMHVYLPPGASGLVRIGDRDIVAVKDPAVADLGAAQVIATRVSPEVTDDVEMSFSERQKGDPYAQFSRVGRRAILAVTLRVPVVQPQPHRWEYKQVPVRVGETLDLETERYRLAGPIVAVGEVQPWR